LLFFMPLIHPSVPWPLPGHPEVMKMEPLLRLFSYPAGVFSEVRTGPRVMASCFRWKGWAR
jgi:hypothetical protein